MSRRVYKFTSVEYGISDLENRRLKIASIDDLNDPFDLCSIDLSHPAIESAVDEIVKGFRGKRGLLCFSRNWDNLLLWSHYGASHTGVCLGFDMPDGRLGEAFDVDVRYQPNLLRVDGPEDVTYDLADRLLRTKHESWSYEQESRVFVDLKDPPDEKGLWWFPFGPELELKEVIVGAQCSEVNLRAVAGALKSFGSTVKCSWAYMRKDAFLLVRHDFPPPWFSVSSAETV